MNIQPQSQNNFKGYDARTLKGFFMRYDCGGVAREMKAIGDIEGFKVFAPQKAKGYQFTCSESLPEYTSDTFNLWAQDKWMIVKNKLFAYDTSNITAALKNFFNLADDSTQNNLRDKMRTPMYNAETLSFFARSEADERMEDFIAYKKELGEFREACHIQGGNVFIVKNGDNDSVIVGKDELQNFSKKEIQTMFETKDLTILPQMDFHLDLFIRPLDNKRILLADDSKSLEVLQNGIDKILKYVNKHPKENIVEHLDVVNKLIEAKAKLQSEIIENTYAQTSEVEYILKKKGYDVIKVPGRVYRVFGENDDEQLLQHYCNYINANVLKNKDGELVYITNRGLVDKMLGLTPELSKKFGFSFENSFVESILPYVKKEHIYFVSGKNDTVAIEMLFLNQGGIHCACMEVPKD